ncbi:MAG: cysteine--tRNA ligase [Candidatus Absconditabacterales bacterium]|nr:cysteine--tRNA ligase [Candidatus Absconditabacterales bacterium]
MKLKIYNTMTHQKEEFIPLMEDQNYLGVKKDFVGIYSCGPTVYRNPHIGNMRAFSFADILRNTIQNVLAYKTKSVMNLTDVGHLTDDADDGEDKMEKSAKRENKDVWELADMYIKKFYQYLESLNIKPFDILPRATEHITEQIDMILELEKKGYTYKIDGDGIYMDTSKIEDYGKLSGLKNQSIKAGARIQNENKKNPTDFSLRKFSPKGEKRQMERNSPWGVGFPGWHIECSAMSSKYLGEQFDIHTGGVDHIGVHHTNEIAQSECAFGQKPWVKYWMHNQFLNLGGKKLSKSEGGLVTVEDLEQKGYSALDLKMLYYTAHYRSFLDFNQDVLDQARQQRQNIIKKLSKSEFLIIDAKSYLDLETKLNTKEGKEFLQNSVGAILDDLNTPKLLAEINKALHNPSLEIVSVIYWLDQRLLRLNLFDFSNLEQEKIEIPLEIKELAQQRWKAKQDKDWTRADVLRDQIISNGWKILDRTDGFDLEKI